MTQSRSDIGRAAVDLRSRRWAPAPVDGVALAPLFGVPGVRYACLADGSSGRRLEQRGDDAGTATPVLEWGLRIASVSDARGRDLDDLMITSASAYHLLRPVPAPGEGTVWVYVCAARDRGNLALTRRALAAVAAAVSGPSPAGEAGSAVLPAVPAPRAARAPHVPRASRTSPALPAALPAPRAAVLPARPAAPVAMAAPAPTRPADPPGSRALRPLPPASRVEGTATRADAPLPSAWRNDLETLKRLLAGLRRLPDPLRGRRTAGDGAIRSLPRSTDRSSSSPKEGRHG